MDGIKAWYLSRTVWGALVAILASALQLTGIDLPAGDRADLVEALVALCATAGALVALYGRIRARNTLAARNPPGGAAPRT